MILGLLVTENSWHMSINTEILTASRDRSFDDWGVIVTFRYFTEVEDSQTGLISETTVDTPLLAIPLNRQFLPFNRNMNRELTGNTKFQFKTEDLPISDPNTHVRILFSGGEYVVTSYELSADALVQTVCCQRRAV